MQHTRKQLSVVILMLLLFSVQSYAQTTDTPTLYLEDQTVDIGQSFSVDIQVENYSSIISTAFSLEWDSTIIEFVGVNNLAFDINENEHFGFTRVGSGILTFSWYDGSPDFQGVSLPDGENIFSINFEAKDAAQSETPITFSDTITMREVADTSFQAVAALFEGGLISVAPSSTIEASLLKAADVSIHPLPFEEKTYLEFTQPVSGDFSVSIIDAKGRVLSAEKYTGITDQQHQIGLDRRLFPTTGAYFVRIVGRQYECSKPIVVD